MKLLLGLLLAAGLTEMVDGRTKVEKITYFNRPNCYRLSNNAVDVIVTTDIGPRIIRYGFTGGDNIFAELPELSVKTKLFLLLC